MQRPPSETVTLGDVVITEELSRRSRSVSVGAAWPEAIGELPRSPNLQAENQAMRTLAQQMVHSPETMLQSLVDMAVELCDAGTAGISLLETTSDGEEIFRWNVLAGTLSQYVGGFTPRNFSPCGICLERSAPQLFSHPERYFTYLQAANTPVVEGLVLPLIADDHVFGTIWIMSHDQQRQFDLEDVRVMASLADFTGAALLLNQRQTKELLFANAALEAEIVERQQAEEKLHQTQTRLELSLTGASLGTWTYNVSTDEFWADDRAKQMHGHELHEVHTFAEAGANIHPEDRERAQAAFAQAIQSCSKLQIEYRVIWPDGSVHGIASYAEFIPMGDSGQGIFYGVVQDISDRLQLEGEQQAALRERKRSEELLRESEARARALIENLPGGAVFVVDHNLRYQLAEGEALSAAGFKPEDLVGRTIFEVLPPELAAYYKVFYRQALAGEPFEHEHNAHGRSYISRGTPLHSANGEVYAVLAVSYDISDRVRVEDERKRVEELLRVSEERLQTAQKAGNVGVWDWDAASGKTYWSETMWTLYGYESQPDKMGDEIWESSQHPEDQQRVMESVALFLASNETDYRSEFRIIQPNGSVRWFESVAQLIRNTTGKPVRMSGVNLDITDRKQVEADLAHSRRQFEKIASTTPDLVYVFDLVGERNIFVNAGIHHVLGYSQAQITTLGSSLIESLIHPDDIPGVIEGNQRFQDLGDQEVYDHELRMRHATGEYRWLRCRDAVFERTADGTVTQTIGTAQDITDRKRTETNLAFLAEVSQDLARLTNIDETMNALGAKIAAHLGLSACAFVELNETAEIAVINHGWHRSDVPSQLGTYCMEEFVTPEILQLCRAGEAIVIRDVFDDPKTDGEQYVALNIGSFVSIPLVRDGEWRFLLVVYQTEPYNWRDDEIEVARELANRIWTRLERARAEEALAKSEERYRTLFTSIDEGFCVIEVLFDEHGEPFDYRFLKANPAFERQTGLENAVGRTVREFAPQHEAFWFETYGRITRTGEAMRFEHQAATSNRFFDVYAFRIGEPEQRQVAVLFNDISERKQAEVNHIQLIREQAARLEAERASQMKDEFLSMVSHELQSPLVAILGWTRLLRANPPAPAMLTKSLQTIERNATVQAKLIQDLLDISRITVDKLRLNLQPLKLRSVIELAIATVAQTAFAKGVNLVWQDASQGSDAIAERAADSAVIMGDGDRLQQIICNLLTNAIKFTPEAGSVTVKLSTINGEPSNVSYAEIRVVDTGIGISAEFLPYVFDRFHQAEKSGSAGGLGLGLAIAHYLVELHGGSIIVESLGIGRGTTFTIKLPLVVASL